MCVCVCVYLLVAGDGVHQPDVQLGVVLGQGLVAIVVDELHHRAERQRVREAVLSVPVEDFDQLVIASFPVKIIETSYNGMGRRVDILHHLRG